MTTLLLFALLSFCIGLPSIYKKIRRWWAEFLLALFLGIVFAVLGSYWLSLFHLDGDFIQSDFLEYCTGVASPHHQSTGVSSKRSTLPLFIPRYFYQYFEIFDALAVGAIFSMACIGSLFYYWGRLLGNRIWSGICVVFAACTLGPLTLIGHHLTSYPEMTLCFVLCAVTTTQAICKPALWTHMIGGIGIGIALLADARGVFWAFPMFDGIMVHCVFIMWRENFKKGLLLIVSCGFPIIYSWFLGNYFFVPQAIGFEEQVDIRPMLYRFLGSASGYEPAYSYESRWVWGLESPLTIFDTVSFLLEQGTIDVPDQLSNRSEVEVGRKLARTYLEISLLSLVCSCFYLYTKDGKRCWALLCSCMPFVVALYGNQSLLENHSRFYFQTLPATAVCMGLCWSIIGQYIERRNPLWYIPQLTLVVCIVLGIQKTPLSPQASWQIRWTNSDASMNQWIQAYQDGEMNKDSNLRHCRRALQMVELDGLPFFPQVYENRE